MVDIKTLLPELKKLVSSLSEDLLQRVTDNSEINAGLKNAYDQIEKGGRTSQAYEVWLEDYLDQVAVAWVLACVFVRFMEDNALIDECWLAGDGDRRKRAEDSLSLYFRDHPNAEYRDYFLHVFRAVGEIPACADLFAEGKTPIWAIGPSGDMAMRLLSFWRAEVEDVDKPTLKWTFTVQSGDTRFLGDLYQGLSQRARDKYALLQTPDFVEEFILSRTLDCAVDEVTLDELRLIDPTCGSGHFLLGAFSRLFRLWNHRTDNDIVAAQRALDGVWGVDVNPFAVAIARFRLIVAALQACGIERLRNAPAWNVHLATGDSLLFGNRWNQDGKKRPEQRFLGTDEESWAPEIYACEDRAISEVLGQQYHAVVGNPPYIRAFDALRNDAYRNRFTSTSGKFTLTIPFFERFFDLCVASKNTGYVGFITSGEFMKADFGKKLVQEFIPTVDVTHVIDTANVPLEGHGTNTVVIFGRNRAARGEVRLVRGIKGESPPPSRHSDSRVWSSIVSQIDVAGYEDEFISVGDAPRQTFARHPWNITGGGAAQVRERIEEACSRTLKQMVATVGIGFVTLKDKVFEVPKHVAVRRGVANEDIVQILNGQDNRDWLWVKQSHVVFPFHRTSQQGSFKPQVSDSSKRFLWPYRTALWNRLWFKKTQRQRNLEWWEFGHISDEKANAPESLFWGEISTHNHFGFDDQGLMGNQTAPMIKLKSPFDPEEAWGLLAVLNSSVACLWLKQVCRAKGGDHVGSKGARVRKNLWDERYAFASRKVSKLPIPDVLPTQGERAEKTSRHVYENTLGSFTERVIPTSDLLSTARSSFDDGVRSLRAVQEEIDWQCYRLYGLLDEPQTLCDDPPSLKPGQRAFEIRMARDSENGAASPWFSRHCIEPVTAMPSEWSQEYTSVVQARLDAITKNPVIRLLESPIYKRRWNLDSWDEIEKRLLSDWLLARIESTVWCGRMSNPSLMSAASASDVMGGDEQFVTVAGLYRRRQDFDLAELVADLIAMSAVPALPAETYSPSGLTKWQIWEDIWDLQRREDNGAVDCDSPKPPEFSKKDFSSECFWKLRKEMNVPMERFFSFPSVAREGDTSLLIGWAGWDHVQQATAIVAYYDARKREGWTAERLTPLLAGLDQLLPWIHQWHPEIDPEYNETAGTSFQTLLESEAQELELTLEDIRNWTPPKKTKKKAGRRKAKE